jgi:glucose-1-phosphate cytidylyltransferase
VKYPRGVDDRRCPVVILCGGKGTRLREETEYKPKPMVEVGGRPILWHVLRTFAAHGFREFVVCLGYRGELIREYFLHYRAMSQDFTLRLGKHTETTYGPAGDELEDCLVTLVDTGQETGTGGRIVRAAPYVRGDRFVVSYGDAVANLDAGGFLDFHLEHGKLATVTTVPAISRFGVLELSGDAVLSFSEKPQLDDWISAGYFVFERGVLDLLGDDRSMFEQGALPALARDDQLRAFRHHGFWQPMDTYREYELLNELWQSGEPPWLRPLAPAEPRVG